MGRTPHRASSVGQTKAIDHRLEQRTASLHDDGIAKAEAFVSGYLTGLQVHWQASRCVQVIAPSPGRVKPGAVSPIQVSVKHKIDGKVLSVPVDAELNRPQSTDPRRIEQAPGTITHTASNDRKSTATIELVSTSKRGIGRTTVTVEVGGVSYIASGGGPGIAINGAVADLAAPFRLDGAGEGFTVAFSYTPDDDSGRTGAVAYSGAGGGAGLQGASTYVVTGDDLGVLTLTATHSGCADIGTCAENVDVVTLTPTP